MKRIFCERKPQRRVTRSEEHEVASVFPLTTRPGGSNDDLEELLADIAAVLDQCAA